MSLNAVLTWYQTKIGMYDKLSWERNVEKCILKGFSNVPKKSTKVKTDFIDVDLVRGSTFPKTKPQHGMLVIARKAFFKTLLLPFFLSWWQQQTSRRFAFLLLLLYILHLSVLAIYLTQLSSKDMEEITLTEVLSPMILMMILGIIHSQVVSTNSPLIANILPGEAFKRKRLKRRRHSKLFTKSASSRRPTKSSSATATAAQQPCDHCAMSATATTTANTAAMKCIYETPTVACAAKQLTTSGEEENDEYSASPPSISKRVPPPLFNTQLSSDSGVSVRCGLSPPAVGVQVLTPPPVPLSDETSDRGEDARSCANTARCCRRHEAACAPPPCAYVATDDQTSDEAKHDSAVQDVSSVELETDQLEPSDLEPDRSSGVHFKKGLCNAGESKPYVLRRRVPPNLHCSGLGQSQHHSCNSSCDSEGDTTSINTPIKERVSPSDMEWGMTTNTDGDHSYESDTSEETEGPLPYHDDPFRWDVTTGGTSTAILNPSCTASDKVSCTIWEGCECKKAELCVLDISSSIVRKVAVMPESTDYFVCGICFAVLMALLPAAFRVHEAARELLGDVTSDVLELSMPSPQDVDRVKTLLTISFAGSSFWTSYIVFMVLMQRFFLCLFFFFLLSVAERTFKLRFLYAKLFSHLTSSRRSHRSELPYFRLNKVRNIKTWLSVRSYLKKHGPQRSVDVIVSAAFVIALLLISFLCVQILKENDCFGDHLYNWEVLAWSFALGVYLLRFMILGAKINKKYRNLSVLLTEQINLYAQMEQKPHKKEGLVLANNVLKLASQLLKELESPFKISGLSANPYLYNITKLVILSAFSAVLTELLGFKLKLYKIKIK